MPNTHKAPTGSDRRFLGLTGDLRSAQVGRSGDGPQREFAYFGRHIHQAIPT
jgi:hypothetical protein